MDWGNVTRVTGRSGLWTRKMSPRNRSSYIISTNAMKVVARKGTAIFSEVSTAIKDLPKRIAVTRYIPHKYPLIKACMATVQNDTLLTL